MDTASQCGYNFMMNTSNNGKHARTRKHDHDAEKLINRDGYSRPNGPNVQIYPERRNREPWTEQIEMAWLDPEPKTKAQKRREQLALRELA